MSSSLLQTVPIPIAHTSYRPHLQRKIAISYPCSSNCLHLTIPVPIPAPRHNHAT